MQKNTSQDIIKTTTVTSNENNQAFSDLTENVLQMMNGKGMIAPSLASSSVNLFKPENKIQFEIIKDFISTRINHFLINTPKPVTLCKNLLIFRDSIKSFKLDKDLLEQITNYDFNVSHANPQGQKFYMILGKK